MLGWFAAHRSLVATLSSTAALAVAIGTTALLSSGFTAQRMNLDDGAVWVVNNAAKAVGRANPQVAELNSVIAAKGSDLEVVQRGSTVLVVDRTNASLDVVNPATSQPGDSIALPPQRPAVWLAGPNAVIMAQGTGEVWIVPISELQGFNPRTPVTYSFGKNAVATVDPGGMLYAYSPGSGQVVQVDAARSGAPPQRSPLTFPSSATSFQISAVGGRWAVLDRTDRRLATADTVLDLSSRIPASASPTLQAPSASGDAVLLASSAGLWSVPLSGGSPLTLVADRTGQPAAPVVRGGCVWAAWSVSGVWRQCGASAPRVTKLDSLSAGARLAFAANGTAFVLSDSRSGDSWAVENGGDLINNWSDLIKKDQNRVEENAQDKPPQSAQQERPPVAVDDSFGARPGRATLLPVLLNDYDPNGDVVVVQSVEPIPAAVGRVNLIARNQQLMITLPERASGVISFRYTIDDGRGGTASALVRVQVRMPWENGPPVQVRPSKTTVQSGAQASSQVLGDWVDPDGDAMFLQSASVPPPDRVSSKPGGVVLFTDSGQGSELKTVALQVSDGQATGTGSLAVTVRKAGQVPIIADPFVVRVAAGQQVTVAPLDHVRGGNGPVRLNAVPAKAGVTIVPSFDKGTFTFQSDQVRAHYLEYVVTDNTQTVTGLIRVDVTAPPSTDPRPITVPKTVFVRFGSSASVDVAGTDIDPAGGVLMVTGVDGLPAAGGLRAEVLEQRTVRVTPLAPLTAPVTFRYTITNGVAEATGSITVIQIPPPTLRQPPIARDDTVTVRAGDVINIPVLANDEQPDGEDVTLEPDLASPLPAGGGLLFTSGSVLRYLAPKAAGNYSAVYRISSAGQFAEATVRISVREKNVSTNNAPVPTPVTARVTAGGTVRITVPLTGIDPDGDVVQLIGQSSSPQKGTVQATGQDWFDYQAGAYSTGSDQFTYTVIDGLGARATGTIRVGISPRVSGARNPVAVADEVTVRPGKSVTVRVLANDSDPDGGPLTVSAVDTNGSGATASIVDGRFVKVTPPPGNEQRSYGLIYTIANDTGGSGSTFLTVRVDPRAPLARPIVQDSVLTVTDVLGRTSVEVAVLGNAFFADGPVSSLAVSLLPGYQQNAEVLGSKRVRVAIGQQSQIIPFAVANPDDTKIRAYAFIRVPGLADALPQLNTRAAAITVKSEQPVTINLNDYVVAIGGGLVRLTDSASVTATHANGSSLVVDDRTLVFTSANQYFGPASITFEVTDGDPADPSARRAVLTLPIKVLPRTNQPPVFLGAALDFEQGQQREIDLVKLTNYPYANDLAELQYVVQDPQPTGFSYALNGQRLVITAADDTATGSTSAITLGVKDALNAGRSGRIDLRIVPSTRPLAVPVPDTAIAPRGQTTVLDVLANDRPGNPFPNTPLRVVKVAGADQGSLPAGVTASLSPDRSRIAVSVAADAPPADVNLQYQVADATGDPNRFVWTTVRLSVQDRPDPVSGVTVNEFGDRTLRLGWQPGVANNSPITKFQVTETAADDGRILSVTDCTGSASCLIATPGNGPANAVRLSVVAVNAIGSSDPSVLPGSIWSDIIPPPPTALSASPLDRGLRVSWRKPDDGGKGSPITFYLVTVGGVSTTYGASASDPSGTGYSVNVTSGSIPNGSATAFSVSARNSAPNSLARWNSASGVGTPAGPPIQVGSPQASTADGTSAALSWSGVFADNGAAITTYYAVAYTGSSPSCTVTGVDSGTPSVSPPTGYAKRVITAGTSASFTGLTPNTPYTLQVFAYNGQGCTASPIAQVIPRQPPGDVTGASFQIRQGGDGPWDYTLESMAGGPGAADAQQFQYQLLGDGVDGTISPVQGLGAALTTTNGSQYGRAISVRLRACVSYPELAQPLCSVNWSGNLTVGVPVRIDLTELRNSVPAPTDVPPYSTRWTWTSSTAGAAYPGYGSAQISCDGGQTFQNLDGGAGVCDSPGQALPTGFPDLLVRVTTTDTSEQRTYEWLN